jgi:tetratricopeptide (TPR) repeat protein
MSYGMTNIKITAILAFFLFFSLLFPVSADDSQDNYGNVADYLNGIYGVDDNAGLTVFPLLNIPIGGHSEGMAGAFSAICDDVSFIEFNPAGSSMLEKSELAFFHNNWIADVKIESIAYSARFKDLGIAAGMKWLYTPFTEYNYYGDRVSNGYYSEGVAILNASYNFFSGYYFSGLSLGMNVKGAFRIMPDYTDDLDNIIAGSGLSQSAAMVMADIGMLTRFNFLKGYTSRDKNASAAVVIRNLGPPALDEPLPTVVDAAISYKPIRQLTFALDFMLPLNLIDISLSELPYGALGVSVNVTKFLSMHSGVLVKPGGSRITVGSAVKMDKISFDVNYTLDLLTQLQPLNRVSLAVRFDLGDGGRGLLSNRVNELYLLGLDAYSQGNLDDARLCWEEALRLDPKYDPARECLDMLKDRDDLRQRIEDLYKLDF